MAASNEVVINPAFFLPPDVVDMRSGVTENVAVEDDDDNIPDDTPNAGLEAPESLTIVDQIVRIGPDGNAVVDVIIEFDDDDHSEYDIRVTKD